jgi:hypothetical protein
MGEDGGWEKKKAFMWDVWGAITTLLAQEVEHASLSIRLQSSVTSFSFGGTGEGYVSYRRCEYYL